jgi:hypothetical protein
MASVVLHSDFKSDKISSSAVDKNKKGGKFVKLSYTGPKGPQRMTIQTPTIPLIFGVSPYQDSASGEIQSYSIDISFRNENTQDFLDKMRHLDSKIVELATANSKEWFGKTMSQALVDEFYRRLVREPSNAQYAPVMKTKISLVNGEPGCLFYDEECKPTTMDAFVKGAQVKLILECDRVWFINKSFGVSWRVLQARVISRPRRLDTYSFQTDDNDGDDVDMNTAHGTGNGNGNAYDDDDDIVAAMLGDGSDGAM